MDLNGLRTRIDELDHQLVSLLNDRAKVSINIGKAKRIQNPELVEEDAQVYIPAREKAVFEKVVKLNTGPLTDKAILAIYREVMSASISLQKDVLIGYLGPPGTFSHQAALSRFGDSVNYVNYSTFSDLFSAVEKAQVSYGVVPFENSTQGTVVSVADRFISTTVQIRAETYLKVCHCLISNSQRHSIKRIYSHSEALGQCRKWLEENMKDVELVSVSSTAQAAEISASELHSAAICAEVCADLYEMTIIERNIQDTDGNTTRFFVIGKESDNSTGDDKTLIHFTVDHRQPGALCDALSVFKHLGINLTKIDSRPQAQRSWHYVFFIEFIGHYKDAKVAEALQQLKQFCVDVHVLGSYPRIKEP